MLGKDSAGAAQLGDGFRRLPDRNNGWMDDTTGEIGLVRILRIHTK